MAKSPAIFAAGEEVEVVCHVEGFEGSIYEARVVRATPKLRLYLVEYETLMDDADPVKNLRERVRAAHVRPRPPLYRCDLPRFEIRQKVDALHNDGWWVGEISKVLEGGRRYGVRFPAGEVELEFGSDEIREHLDFIDGMWIGTSPPRCIGSREAQSQDKFVMPQNLWGIETNDIKELWHAIRIAHEPQFPLQSSTLSGGSRNNESACRLDYSAANLDSIISKESMSQVQLESSQLQEKSIDIEAIRDDFWFSKTGFEVNTPTIEEMTTLHLEPLIDPLHCSTVPSDENRLLKPVIETDTASNLVLEEIDGEGIISMNSTQQLAQHTPRKGEISFMKEEFTKLGDMGYTNQSVEADAQQPRKKVASAPRHGSKEQKQSLAGEKGIKKRGTHRKERMRKPVTEKDGIELKQLEEKHGIVVKRSDLWKQAARKRSEPKKVRIIDTEDLIEGNTAQNEGVTAKQDAGETNEMLTGGKCTSQLETETPELSDIIVDSNAVDVQIENSFQPCKDVKETRDEAFLSGARVAKVIEIKDRSKAECALLHGDQKAKETEGEGIRIVTDHISNNSSLKNSCLPFAKTSPLWEAIESSEVFTMMPQQPHFLPLKQYSLEFREGMAIGLMVTFTNLVNKIMKLQIDAADTLQEMMETLISLEGQGFNVQHLQSLLRKFQTIKGNQKQLLHRRSSLEGLILERRNKKVELDAKFELIDMVVMRLEETLKYFCDEKASIVKQREENDHEMDKLQIDARTIEESSLAAEQSFLNVFNAARGSFADTG